MTETLPKTSTSAPAGVTSAVPPSSAPKRKFKWPAEDSVLRRINWPYVGRVALKVVLSPFVLVGVVLAGLVKGAINGIGYLRAKKGTQKKGNKDMGIMSNLFGAAVLAGAIVGPGVYQMTQQNEIVRAKVTGRQQADADSKYSGLKYFLYTDVAGKLDTFSIPNGREFQEGCLYDFNLKGARIQKWPLGYSRSVVSATKVTCPGQ